MTLAYSGKVATPITISGDPCEDMPLHEAIGIAIEKYPEQIALAYKERQLTYSELDVAATALAFMLADQGIGHKDKVAVLMHRTDKLVVSLLAILRLGAAYIPIDPSCPDERVDFILEDTGAGAIILGSQSTYLTKNPDVAVFSEVGIPLEKDDALSTIEQYRGLGEGGLNQPLLNPSMVADDLAYIIYTSGSTGQPKGVMVTHANGQNYAYWARIELGMTEADVVDFSTTMAFDIAFSSTILALICGAKIVVCPEQIKQLPKSYLDFLNQNLVSAATLTPSYFSQLRQALEDQPQDLSLRTIWLIGEALVPSDVKIWLDHFPNQEIINEYGPTEATVGITSYKISAGDPCLETANIPIGKAAFNSTAYILDSEQNPCAEGESGELCIAGKSVTAGYLNRPELNQIAFMDDPFSEKGKLYRTGDLVQALGDGNLIYLGRIDRQIKIRGFRIEPGEIEVALLDHHLVQAAAIVPQVSDEGTKLIAYLVVNAGEVVSIFELRQFLQKRLPDYMLPSHFMFLGELPLNISGKLDRASLPLPSEGITGAKKVAAANEVEKTLLDIWMSALNSCEFGVTDDFFLIGGDSLNAARIIDHIEKQFSVSLSLQDFYNSGNIRILAEHVDKKVIEALKDNASFLDILSEIESMSEGQIEGTLKK